MRLSKTELRILEQIASGKKSVKEIALALNRSKVQIYKAGTDLMKKGFILRSEGLYEPEKATHVTLLLQLLAHYPNLVSPLSSSGIRIFTAILEGKTFRQVIKETELKRALIFKKFKEAKQIGLITVKKRLYTLNQRIWLNLKEFLSELKKHEETIDPRIPANSTIYFKNKEDIVFSNRDEIDATLTGFSAYANYGIKILSSERTYYLPKKVLSKKEIFLHSLYVTDRDKSARHITFIILFYVKFRRELEKIKHPLIDFIKRILAGEKISGYPDLNEIREKGDVYDIQV